MNQLYVYICPHMPSLLRLPPKHSKLSKMRRQRNTQQMKEQSKNPPDQTNEEEIGSLPEIIKLLVVILFLCVCLEVQTVLFVVDLACSASMEGQSETNSLT